MALPHGFQGFGQVPGQGQAGFAGFGAPAAPAAPQRPFGQGFGQVPGQGQAGFAGFGAPAAPAAPAAPQRPFGLSILLFSVSTFPVFLGSDFNMNSNSNPKKVNYDDFLNNDSINKDIT